MFKSYTQSILSTYKKREEAGSLSSNLRNPTPAGLRAECLHVYKENDRPTVESALRAFFGPLNGDVDYLHRIENIDIDKFRPLVNLWKGKINNPSKKNIELLEWLMGKEIESKITEGVTSSKSKKILSKVNFNKLIVAVAVIGIFGSVAFIITKPKYMYWTGEKYEAMAFYRKVGDALVLEYDKYKFSHLKRITQPDTITERSVGRIWYIKVNVDSVDFYTSKGEYPLDTSKVLKPATKYIIDKYVGKKDSL